MDKSIKSRNKKIDYFLDLNYFMPNTAQKFDEYYSDVHKERLIDYPMAILSALVRMSLG